MPAPLLEIQGLGKRYGKVHAVDGLDLAVREGSIYGFIGPNGAGKTTTIRILAGLVFPDGGRVRMAGRDLLADRVAVASGIRTLVEVPAFYTGLTGRENLEIHLRLVGADPRDADRLLDAVALSNAAQRKVGGYSLGMRQRLGIAQALVGRPRLVILDEPMNGLDPAGMREMRALIRRRRDEHGTTFLISSHLLDDVERLSDDVGMLHRGRMVAEGPIEAFRSTRILGFEVRTPDDARALQVLEAALPEARPHRDDDGVLRVEGEEAMLPALHRALLDQGLYATEIAAVREGLETAFLEKTEGVIG